MVWTEHLRLRPYLCTGDGCFPQAQVLTPPVRSCHVQLEVRAFFLYQKYFILQLGNNLAQDKQPGSYENNSEALQSSREAAQKPTHRTAVLLYANDEGPKIVEFRLKQHLEE